MKRLRISKSLCSEYFSCKDCKLIFECKTEKEFIKKEDGKEYIVYQEPYMDVEED